MSGLNNMQPRVTLLVPVFNHKPFLTRLCESLLAQDYRNVHLVISDDHSEDGGHKVIQSFTYSLDNHFAKFSYVRHGVNLGLRGRNNMKHLSTWIEKDSDYVAVLDGDDALTPSSISTRVKALQQNPQLGCVHGNFFLNTEDGSVHTSGWEALGASSIPSGFIYDHLLINNRIIMSTAMFPKDLYLKYFDYQKFTDLGVFLGDYVGCLSLAKNHEIMYLKDEMLAHYRKHSKGESSNPDERQMIIEDTMRIQHLFKTGQVS